ncbi:hypothetical protein [Bacillus phage CP-51]|uniref:Uncharacterized protein n=1 Tax=Bacillus phage CP-51 TaxID=1391188 RepID=A0A068EUB1_9CAUD|nr:hypothetical protein OZ73_gp191 [Bacillus phage CP-51]AID50626.1 hypothetical protein [Bacillus phage CP-51]
MITVIRISEDKVALRVTNTSSYTTVAVTLTHEEADEVIADIQKAKEGNK